MTAAEHTFLLTPLSTKCPTSDLLLATKKACEAEQAKATSGESIGSPARAPTEQQWRAWYGPKVTAPERGLSITRQVLNLPKHGTLLLGRPVEATHKDTLSALRRIVIWSSQSSAADVLPRPPDLDIEAVLEQLRTAWQSFEATAADILEMASVAAGVESEPSSSSAKMAATQPANAINLMGIPGPNRTARLVEWVRRNDPGVDKLSWSALHDRARAIRATRPIIDETTPRGVTTLSFGPSVPVPSSRSSAPATRSISLRGIVGPNPFARLITWLKANEPGADKLTWDQINQRARTLARDPNVLIDDAT